MRWTQYSPPTTPEKYRDAGFFSKLAFIWVVPLMSLSSKKTLEDSDLPELESPEDTKFLSDKIGAAWQEQLGRKHPSLVKALWSLGSTLSCSMLALLFVDSAACVAQTLVLGRLIWYFNEEQSGISSGIIWASVLTGVTLLENALHHYFYFWTWRLGLRWRTSAVALIFQKCLRLQVGALSQVSVGQVLNLAANDAERFQLAGVYFLFLVTAPVLAIVTLYIGVLQIGPAFAAGWGALVLLVPLQLRLSALFGRVRRATAERTDRRVQLTAQALGNWNLMKLNGWEFPFLSQIRFARAKEFRAVLYGNYLRAVNESIFFITPTLLSVVTFLVYVQLGHTLDSHTVFTVVALLNLLQVQLTKYMAVGIQAVSEAWISMKRIQEFLELPEVLQLSLTEGSGEQQKKAKKRRAFFKKKIEARRPLLGNEERKLHYQAGENEDLEAGRNLEGNITSFPKQMNQSSTTRILLQQACFNWNVSGKESGLHCQEKVGKGCETLMGINLHVDDGELVALVGSVGSAKTSLLMALLNELNFTQGTYLVKPSEFAFASQEPWIAAGTIRSNILFGQEYNQARFQRVVEHCALQADLEALPEGDLTEVGEQGTGLSGGQRARVGLARLAYAREVADCFLMDDPLSAVDPAVGKKLFDNVVCGYLAQKTRVLVTHQIQYLQHPDVSRIYVLEGGKVKGVGKLADLVKEGVISSEYFQDCQPQEQVEQCVSQNFSSPDLQCKNLEDEYLPHGNDDVNTIAINAESELSIANKDQKNQARAPGDEEIATGAVTCTVYHQYIQSMGGFLAAFLGLFLLGGAQAVAMYFSAFLAHWSEMDDNEQLRIVYRQKFVLIAVVAALLSVAASMSSYTFLSFASHRLHGRMLKQTLLGSFRFFSSNPFGRIMNRFSKDMGYLDDLLPFTIYDFLQCLVMVIASILFIGVAEPTVYVALPVLGVLFVKIRNYSTQSSRMLKRMEAVSRSPVYATIAEALEGLPVIRSFGQQNSFMATFQERYNCNSRAYYNWLAVVRWLGFYLDMLVVLMVGAATYICVYINEKHYAVDGAVLGAALTYLILLAGLFQWTVRQSSEVENQMVSVERVLKFCDNEQEAPLLSQQRFRPPSDWPSSGRLQAINLSAAYEEGKPPILKNVSFEISGGEKVGVVGRTGAGKSSLVNTLFRLIEPLRKQSLYLDGRDVTEIGLHDLRHRMAIIPQVPFLFSGTIRQNLDPFDKIKAGEGDEKLWKALETVRLAQTVKDLPGGLESLVSDGGGFSVGQRQLFCMARALVTEAKVIVMDEATANVDLDTDAIIQRALRTQFKDSTVIMIAHRLQTVIDCNKIIVLSQGKMVEFGSPHELLSLPGAISNPHSFASMVQESGAGTSRLLKKQAREYHSQYVQQAKDKDGEQ